MEELASTNDIPVKLTENTRLETKNTILSSQASLKSSIQNRTVAIIVDAGRLNMYYMTHLHCPQEKRHRNNTKKKGRNSIFQLIFHCNILWSFTAICFNSLSIILTCDNMCIYSYVSRGNYPPCSLYGLCIHS